MDVFEKRYNYDIAENKGWWVCAPTVLHVSFTKSIWVARITMPGSFIEHFHRLTEDRQMRKMYVIKQDIYSL